MRITDYRVEKLIVPERLVSDSAIDELELDEFEYVYLELETNTGERGIGYSVVDMESPASTPVDVWRERFAEIFQELEGKAPAQICNSLSRHRGGMVAYHSSESYGTGLRRAVDFALWDLCGKQVDLPVYRLMGGDDPKVPVYASGLAFASDDQEVVELYERAKERGIQAAKVKVGYPTIEEDIERIRLVEEVFDGDCTLMVDANEKWSAKETIRRVRAYEAAGLDIYWMEDPMFREDVAGQARVAEQIPSTHLNTGEYRGFEGKRELLEHGAVDILNVHGFSPARKAAHLAYAHAVPVATGTDHAGCVSAVHVGAALPEVTYAEFTMQRFYDIADQPFDIEDGYAIAPDKPGHGVELSDDVIQEYSVSG